MNIMENEQKRQMRLRSEEIANHRSSAFKNLLKMDLFLSWSLFIALTVRLLVTGQVFIKVNDGKINSLWMILTSIMSVLLYRRVYNLVDDFSHKDNQADNE